MSSSKVRRVDFGDTTPSESKFRAKWRPNPIEYGRLAEYFQASAPGLCYGDVFESRFLFARATGLDASVWWLRFYRGPVFRCFVTSPVLPLAPTA